MQQRKPGSLPPEAKAGEQVVRAFMALGVNDMASCLEAMRRVYENARIDQDSMVAQALESI